MLIQMYIQLYAPYDISDSHTLCVFRVIWRWFGLASGCIALVMAIERYFAITRPFFYQMVIKKPLIYPKRIIKQKIDPLMNPPRALNNHNKLININRFRLGTPPAEN